MSDLSKLETSETNQALASRGPLLSVIALLLWAGATSLALQLGMATTAELAGETSAARGAAADQPLRASA